MNKLISIIIPVYNVCNYLERCVKSLCDQTYKKIEIILVDDGSTDGSGILCDELAKVDERIIVIHQNNQGLGPARNAGLEVMKGEFVGFVDSDDWISNEMYETLYSAIKQFGCEIATCGRLIVSDDRILNSIYCKEQGELLSNVEAIEHFMLQKDMNMSVCDKLFKSSLFDDIRFPGDFYISEDILPTYKLLKKAKGVYLTGKPLYNYYHRIGSLSKSTFTKKSMGARLYSVEVAQLVRCEYPKLKEVADYFEYDELLGTYRIIRRSNYIGEEYYELLEYMKKNFVCIIKNRHLYIRQKLYICLALLNADRLADRIYVLIKRNINLSKRDI